MCMSLRGVEKPGSSTITTQFTGTFRERPERAGPLHDPGARGAALIARDANGYAWPTQPPLRQRGSTEEVEEGPRSRRSSTPTGSSPASPPMRARATC